jgi:hypothetical protein
MVKSSSTRSTVKAAQTNLLVTRPKTTKDILPLNDTRWSALSHSTPREKAIYRPLWRSLLFLKTQTKETARARRFSIKEIRVARSKSTSPYEKVKEISYFQISRNDAKKSKLYSRVN